MLVLTRKRRERIHIGDDIVITVLEFDSGGQVRIGIEAPRALRVLRGEIHDQIQAENQRAQAPDPSLLAGLQFPPAQPGKER